MKAKIILSCTIVLMSCGLPNATGQVADWATTNEDRQIRFAERVIAIELIRALSPIVRTAREKCPIAIHETGALELGIGLIGVGRSDASADGLINLLGLRLDGAGSEELNCQILARGAAISPRLERLRVAQVVDRCRSTFIKLRKTVLADLIDVRVEQVCRSEAEIRSACDKLLRAVESKVMCEQ